MANALDVVIRFIGDSSKAVAAAKETDQAYSKTSKSLTKTGLAMSAAVTAPLVLAGRAAIQELESAEKVAAQTNAVIKSTGGAANVSAKEVQNLASAIAEKSGMDDEAIASGENLLLTFTKVRNEAGKGNDIFNQATTLAADLSIAWGIDMSQASVKLGKALQDPVAGINALARVGVTFTAQQKEQVKALVESGDVMGAQKLILKELETQVGGSAKAFGETLPGQLAKAREQMNNTGASIAMALAPALKLAGELAQQVAAFFESLPAPVRTALAAFLVFAAALGPLLTLFGNLARLGHLVQVAFSAIADAAGAAVGKLTSWGLALEGAAAGIGTLATAVAVAVAAGYVLHRVFGTDLNEALKEGQEAGTKWGQALAANSSQITDLTAQHDQLKAAIAEVNTTEITSVEGAMKHHAALEVLRAKVAENEAAQRAAANAGAHQAQVMNELAAASHGLTGATNEQIAAVMNLANAYLAQQGGALGLAAAQQQEESARKRLDELIAGGSIPTSLEYRQAQTQVEQATLATAGAALKMQADNQTLANQLSGPGLASLIATRDSLQQTVDAHLDATGAAQKQIDKINLMIDVANGVPPEKSIYFNADTWAAIQGIHNIESEADRAARERTMTFLAQVKFAGTHNITGGGSFDQAMTGGVVKGPPGTPRLMIVHGGETIVPTTGVSSRLNRSEGPSNTFHITVNVPPGVSPAEVGARTVDAIRQYERVAGRAWREN